VLKASARQQLAAGQGELDLRLERTATLPCSGADASLYLSRVDHRRLLAGS